MEDYKKRKRYKRNDFTLDKSGTGVRVPDNSSAALEGALRSFKKNLKIIFFTSRCIVRFRYFNLFIFKI